jgi:hypothetical protein
MTEQALQSTTTNVSSSIGPRARRPIPDAIQDALAFGAAVRYDEDLAGWTIGGFYRSRGIVVRYTDPALPNVGTATSLSVKKRQNLNGHTIKSFDDLVDLNYVWWNYSRKEHIDFETPDELWRDEFVARDWVERRTVILPKRTSAAPI